MNRERTRSRGRGLWIAMAAAALATGFGTAQAQEKAAGAPGIAQAASEGGDIRLYGFSSGALTIGKGALLNFGPMEPSITVPVGFYVVKHPKGNILFDTGNNDKLITDPNWWGKANAAMKPAMTPDVAIDVQLKKIGLTPDDIAYVVPSHLHLDHGGNVGKFPNSTIVVQRSELLNALWPAPGTGNSYVVGDILPLRSNESTYPNSQKMVLLEGDMDIYGDGSVVIKRWVAHTPGSQMMVVKLKNRGTTILTGDNAYFRENVEKNIPPNLVLAYNPQGFFTAYEWIRTMMATEKADFFTAHDPDAFKAMKKAPEYYD